MGKDIEFMSEQEHRYSQKIDYAEVVTEQLNKVRTSGSTEFRGGYWEERKKMMQGQLVVEKVYVPDTRQAYINSITQLYDLLLPFYDKDFREANKGILEKIRKLRRKRKKKKEDLTSDRYTIWFYSNLLKIKRRQYRQLVMLMGRLGMLGIKKSKEVY